jgi:hypothetical protein
LHDSDPEMISSDIILYHSAYDHLLIVSARVCDSNRQDYAQRHSAVNP